MRMTPEVLQLLNGGDMACAFREWDKLARICNQMVELVQLDYAEQARRIAGEAAADAESARHLWAEFAGALRHSPN